MERKYRKLLVEIAREITREDLETMRFMTLIVQEQTQSDHHAGLYLEVLGFFRALEQAGSLGCENLDDLSDWLATAGRQDLAWKIENFRSSIELSSSGPASCEAVRPPTDEKKERREDSLVDVSQESIKKAITCTEDEEAAKQRKREKKKNYKKRKQLKKIAENPESYGGNATSTETQVQESNNTPEGRNGKADGVDNQQTPTESTTPAQREKKVTGQKGKKVDTVGLPSACQNIPAPTEPKLTRDGNDVDSSSSIGSQCNSHIIELSSSKDETTSTGQKEDTLREDSLQTPKSHNESRNKAINYDSAPAKHPATNNCSSDSSDANVHYSRIKTISVGQGQHIPSKDTNKETTSKVSNSMPNPSMSKKKRNTSSKTVRNAEESRNNICETKASNDLPSTTSEQQNIQEQQTSCKHLLQMPKDSSISRKLNIKPEAMNVDSCTSAKPPSTKTHSSGDSNKNANHFESDSRNNVSKTEKENALPSASGEQRYKQDLQSKSELQTSKEQVPISRKPNMKPEVRNVDSTTKTPATKTSLLEHSKDSSKNANVHSTWNILLLSNKWRCWGESIPVLNRELCLAFAGAGHNVACLVLDSSEVEREEARQKKIDLQTCSEKPEIKHPLDPQRFQYHDLEDLPFTPDLVIGHGKVTGPAALFYSQKISCPRLHVIHDLPEECLKYDEVIDKQYNEEELAKTADFVAAIGTLLHEKWSVILNRADVIEVIPGLPNLETRNRISSPHNRYFVPLKFCSPKAAGLRLAILAINKSGRRDTPPREATFMPRNTESKGSTKSSEKLLKELDKSCVELNVHAESKQALVDLQGATLFFSPARTEAFGVSALDAIAIGIPIIISARSGLAYTIRKYLKDEFHACIQEVSSESPGNVDDVDEDTDADVWANEIDKVSYDREAAFTSVEAMKAQWKTMFTWDKVIQQVVDVMIKSGKISSNTSKRRWSSINKRIPDSTIELVKDLNLFNKKEKFVLFLSPEEDPPPEMAHLVLVSWAAVFDFDQEDESTKNSCLKTCETFLKNIGRPVCRLFSPLEDETGKQRQNAHLSNGTPWILLQGSLPDMSRNIENSWDWVQEILNQIKKRYPCPVTLLVLWNTTAENKSLCKKLSKILTIIQASPSWKNSVRLKILSTSQEVDSRFEDIAEDWPGTEVLSVNLVEFCRAISSVAIGNNWFQLMNTDFSLPKMETPGKGPGKVVTAALPPSIRWVDSVLEVLYTNVGDTPEFGKDDAYHFYRGGKISWYGIEMNYAVERESWGPIRKEIENEIKYSGAFRLTLVHQRGTGGTTSARKLLYDFHMKYPCVCLKSINVDTSSAIKVIWQFCALPVLILADFKDIPDINDVTTLYRNLSTEKISCLILHIVHRQHDEREKKNKELVLATNLTPEEQKKITELYSSQCRSKRADLNYLKNSGDEHLQIPFYYGLVAFGDKFKGLEPFVRDCLKGLDAEQSKAMCFLAMAHYYGQREVPVSALARIFNLRPFQLHSIEDILPPSANELLIEDAHGLLRPRHFTIGKEIICQLLTLPYGINKENWRLNLAGQTIEFIALMAEDLVNDILLNRIADEQTFKKFSSLVEDISDIEEVVKIFSEAIKSYPCNPYFKAHLGRYYSVEKEIDGFEDALKCTDDAILFASEYPKSVRIQFTQMKGIVYKRQVKYKIDKKAPLEEIITLAEEGVKAFTRAVSISSDKLEDKCIPQVRMMCDIFDYINRSFDGGIFVYLNSRNAHPFILSGITDTSDVLETVSDSLCYPDLRRKLFRLGGRKHSEKKTDLIAHFKELKKTNKISIASINRQIVLIELELCKEGHRALPEAAEELKQLLEEALKYDEKIDLTMRLWVKVAPYIPVSLLSAESKIATWCKKGKSAQSYLYRYIFACIRILEGGDEQHKKDMLRAWEQLHETVSATSRDNLRPAGRPVVFLGTGKGMEQLVFLEENVREVRKQRTIPDDYDQNLRRLTGTITKTGKVGEIKAQGLTISFRADLCQPTPLVGESYLAKKVKLYLAFTYFGLDSYNVKILAD